MKMLPDWESVEIVEGQDNVMGIPSFWAAEVQELPRGAGIEWAALSGVVGASVKVRDLESFLDTLVERLTDSRFRAMRRKEAGRLSDVLSEVLCRPSS